MSKSKAPFITIFKLSRPANKIVTLVDGKPKKGMVKPMVMATATTVRVDTLKALADQIATISEDPNRTMSLGYVPGTEPEDGCTEGKPYLSVSKGVMGKALDVDPETPEGLEAILGWHEVDDEPAICRLKANTVPGNWCLLDIDKARGMPDDLASMNSKARRDALVVVFPDLAEAGFVRVPSTTGRVLVDGEPMDATGEHLYFLMDDATDLERYGAVLLQRSLLAGYGFMKPEYSHKNPDEQVGQRPWGINDPTTFSCERLVFDGKPVVEGEGLSVAKAEIEVIGGRSVDTHKLLDLTDEEADAYAEVTGQRVVKGTRTTSVMGADGKMTTRRVVHFMAIDTTTLQMDTVIETAQGNMTIEEYWKSDLGKLRCQTPFRDSTSENGILNRHKDGTPFVFDNGERSRFVLSEELIRKHRANIYMSRLALLSPDEIKDGWVDGLEWMTTLEREQIRQRVAKLTSVPAKELKEILKEAEMRWVVERTKARNAALKADIKDSGRAIVRLDNVDNSVAVRKAEEGLFTQASAEPLLSHGGRLVSVRMAKPTTVREVRQERSDAPLSMIVDPYLFHGLTERTTWGVAFVKVSDVGGWYEVPPPSAVIRAMLEDSHKRAPALVGIIEHPVMGQDGELLVADGMSSDGLFVRIPDRLLPDLPEVTQKMAQASYQWLSKVALADFPFATDIDEAGAVSALLTGIQRRMFDSNEGCPGFLTTAPVQSSGKTAFFQLLFALVWGRTASATNWSSSEEELNKHILAILLEGHGGVLFDNLEEGGQVESNTLARAMTSPKFTGRFLGENREATVPTNCLWCFTGNNISASGDFNTRILSIKIDPGMENPDQRTFSRPDLAEWCEEHRAEFFHHAMTIMVGYQRHYREHGPLPDVKPTRYTKWDEQVRQAMIWAGSADPAELFEQNKAEDPKKEGRKNLLAAWWGLYKHEPKYLHEVLSAIDRPHHSGPGSEDLIVAGEALRDLLPNGKITSRSLGTVIRKFSGQWIDGYRIVPVQTSAKTRTSKRWFLERQEGRAEDSDTGQPPSAQPDESFPVIGGNFMPKPADNYGTPLRFAGDE
jgi:hypothetical protein